MGWLDCVELCEDCRKGPLEGYSIVIAKCKLCSRIGCEDLVNGYKSQCVPSADDDSCLEYVE